MGLIELYKNESFYNKDKQEYEWRCVWNGLVPTNTFLNSFVFKKANKPFVCGICKKEKPKNTRYVGNNWVKVCCDCSSEWIKNSKFALQEIEVLLDEGKKDLELNKDKWRKEMIIGALN